MFSLFISLCSTSSSLFSFSFPFSFPAGRWRGACELISCALLFCCRQLDLLLFTFAFVPSAVGGLMFIYFLSLLDCLFSHGWMELVSLLINVVLF